MRFYLLLALTACWSSAPAKPAQPEPYVIPPRDEPPAEPPIACATFSEANPACASACPRDAPDDWRGCETLAARLQSGGYVCSNLHPRTCLGPQQLPIPPCPPGGCVPVKARVIAKRVEKGTIEITFAAGKNEGVTLGWRARVVALDLTPVVGGDVTLTRVDRSISVGTITLTADQIEKSPYVYLEP